MSNSPYFDFFIQRCFNVIGHICVLCGSTEEMEIDHIDPNSKSFAVSKVWSLKRYTWQIILEELKKCQPLCHKCHKKKSADEYFRQSNPINHGSIYGYKRGCRCEDCKSAQKAYKREWRNRKTQCA